MLARRLEVIRNNGNHKSKFTITHERITIKLRDEDLNREAEIVALGEKIASQIPLTEASLRGSLGNGGSNRLKLSTGHLAVSYLFDVASGDLLRIRKSGKL